MSAIDQAKARLDAALDRLERAIEARGERVSASTDGSADAALQGEVEGLREECHELRERLAAAEARHGRLKDAMTTMGGRLDVAIAELDALMQDRAAE